MKSFFEYEESQQSVQEVWDDPETIFVVDTNIFLNIYVFHQETRQAIYDALDKVKERLWSPHQVMLEFHKNRAGKIQESKKRLDTIESHINKFIKQFKFKDSELTTCDNQYGKWYPSIREHLTIFQKNAQVVIKNQFEELEKSLEVEAKILREELDSWKKQIIPSVTEDSIYQKLCEFYSDDKIGEPFTQLELDALYKEGEWRFQHDVPPGYKDKGKDEIYHHRGIIYHSKFGDLILYKQILEHCKTHHIKNVILVSEDNKGDWVDKDTKALRKEIRGEAFEVAGIQNFIMVNKDSLLAYSEIEKSPQVKEDFDNLASEGADENFILANDLEAIGSVIFDIYFHSDIKDLEKYRIFCNLASSNCSLPIMNYNDIQESLRIDQGIILVYKTLTESILEDKLALVNVEKEIKRIINDNRIDIKSKMNLLIYICGIDNQSDINSYMFSFYPHQIIRMLEKRDNEKLYACVLHCYNEKNPNDQLSL